MTSHRQFAPGFVAFSPRIPTSRHALMRATAMTGGVLAAMLVLVPNEAKAQQIFNWSGNYNSNPSLLSNWSNGYAPMNNDRVTIEINGYGNSPPTFGSGQYDYPYMNIGLQNRVAASGDTVTFASGATFGNGNTGATFFATVKSGQLDIANGARIDPVLSASLAPMGGLTVKKTTNTTEPLNGGGTVSNRGTIGVYVSNSGSFTNFQTGIIGNSYTDGSVVNYEGAIGDYNAPVTNVGWRGAKAGFFNFGTITGKVQTITNNPTQDIYAVRNYGGYFLNGDGGIINRGLRVDAGYVENRGNINHTSYVHGGILSNGGVVKADRQDGLIQIDTVSGTMENVTVGYIGTFNNVSGTVTGTTKVIGGTVNNSGVLSGPVNVSAGTLNSIKKTVGAENTVGATPIDLLGSITGDLTQTGGTINNFTSISSTLATVNGGLLDNKTGGTIGALTVGTANLSTAGTVTNSGMISSAILLDRTSLTNKSGGSIGSVSNGGTFINELGATVTGNVGNNNLDANLIKSINFGTITGNLSVSGGSFTQAGTLNGTATVNTTGTLIFGNGDTVGNFSSNLRTGGTGLTNNGRVVFDSTARDTVIDTVISGTGIVENRGGNNNGAVTLTANQTYTGKTIVSSGFLALKGTFATSAFEVNNSGIIVIDRDVDTNFNTSVTGTGGFLKRGTGTMTLDTTLRNTGVVSVAGGRLQFGAGAGANNGINQASVLEVSNGGEIALGNTAMKVGGLRGFVNGSGVSGVISGNGNIEINTATGTTNQLAVALGGNGRSITKTGAGTQEFYGANTYTGGTTIKAGILKVGSSGALGTATNVAVETGANLELGTLGNFAGADFTFDKIITGAGGLIKTSSNTVTLSAVNTYTGDTQVKEGTLRLAGTGKIALASKIIISAGANFDIGTTQFTTNTLSNITGNLRGGGTLTLRFDTAETYSGKISDGLVPGEKFKLAVTGGSPVTLNGDNSFTGGLEISGHNTQVILGSNNAAGGANNTILTRGTIITYANGVNNPTPITIGSNTTQLDVAGTDSATQSGIISEDQADRPLEKIGTGTLILTAANTYSGVTTISAGTLNIQSNNALGTTAGGTVVAAGAALELQGGLRIGAEALTLNGTGVGGGGALRNVSAVGNNAYGGVITLGSNASIVNASDLLFLNGNIILGVNSLTMDGAAGTTIDGIVSGTGGVIKNGTGDLTLGALNTFSGGLTVNAGNVDTSQSTGLGTGALTVNFGEVRLRSVAAPSSFTVASLSGTGGVIKNSNGSGADSTLILDGNSTSAFAGALQNGTSGNKLAVKFTGGGTTTLSGTNTLTGGIEIAGTGTRVNFANSSSTGGATNTLTLSGTGNVLGLTGAGSSTYTSPIALTGTGARIDLPNLSGTATLSGVVSGSGGFELTGTSGAYLAFSAGVGMPLINTYSGATTITGGKLIINDTRNLGDDSATNRLVLNGGILGVQTNAVTMARGVAVNATGGAIDNNSDLTLNGGLSIAAGGTVRKTNSGTLTISGTGTGTGTGVLSMFRGDLVLNSNAALGGASLQVDRATNLSSTGNITFANAIVLNAGLTAPNTAGNSLTLSGPISGTGSVTKASTGTLNLTGANSFTGGVSLSSGTLGVGSNMALGTKEMSAATQTTLVALASVNLANNIILTPSAGFGTQNLIVDTNSYNLTLSGVISKGAGFDAGVEPGLTKNGAGNLILSGTSTYKGATIVNAGKLIVNGSIANTSSVTIANGAVLGGNAAIPNLTVQTGASLSPGNSVGVVNIAGNLVLNAGSTTVIEIQNSTVDKINAGGTAAINGTLQLVALGGPYNFGTPYNFLTANGGVSGTFAAVNTDAAFGIGVTSAVSYNATNAFVTLTAAPIAQTATTIGLTRPKNVFAVASGMDRAVANGANPSAFFNVYNQPTREALAAAVNSLSGEVHTSGNAMAVQASDQFLRVMLDPTAIGRDSTLLTAAEGAAYSAAAFSAARGASELPSSKAPVVAAARELPKNYRVWGAAMGQTGRVDGDAFTVGSARIKTNDGQLAMGADVALARDTMAGVAISAGQSEATLGNGMGSAKADIYQAGLYGTTRFGALSLAASGAYSSLQMETNRAVPVLGVNSVKGKYRAEGWSGRIEGAWAVAKVAGITISPTLAMQVQSVRTPGFTETNGLSGAAFGVSSLGRTNNTARSELGVKMDIDAVIYGSQINLYAKAAWAHYAARDAKFSASLVGLAGSAFTVEGARPARDSALLAIGADMRLSPATTFGASFNSELSSSTQSYAGSAKLRYAF